jgi:hypothetical protein
VRRLGARGPVAAWSIGGLEQPLVACLLAWSIVLVVQRSNRPEVVPRAFLAPGLLLGGICLTRPDGPLFTLVIGLWMLLHGTRTRATLLRCAWLVLPSVTFVLLQLAFRRMYYHDWLPNVAYIKVNPSVTRLLEGLRYVGHGIAAFRPIGELSLLAIVFLCWRKTTRNQGLLVAGLVIVWLGYLAFIGGDIFPAWRHMLPAFVVFLLADVLALDQLANRPARWIPALTIVLAGFVFVQFHDEKNQVPRRNVGNGMARWSVWF